MSISQKIAVRDTNGYLKSIYPVTRETSVEVTDFDGTETTLDVKLRKLQETSSPYIESIDPSKLSWTDTGNASFILDKTRAELISLARSGLLKLSLAYDAPNGTVLVPFELLSLDDDNIYMRAALPNDGYYYINSTTDTARDNGSVWVMGFEENISYVPMTLLPTVFPVWRSKTRLSSVDPTFAQLVDQVNTNDKLLFVKYSNANAVYVLPLVKYVKTEGEKKLIFATYTYSSDVPINDPDYFQVVIYEDGTIGISGTDIN